jgi:hypothetical protein
MLPPERRLGGVLELINEHKFFTLHAGRQTGKTTCLMWLERHLNETGRFRALWVELEPAHEQSRLAPLMTTILGCLERALALRLPYLVRPVQAQIEAMLRIPENALLAYLTRLAALDCQPLVILFDEADGLAGNVMGSFLTQLRAGYIERSLTPFPASVVLVGWRQVRDPHFNITTAAMTLSPFTEPEVKELLEQHTAVTGQRFELDGVTRIWELAQGHPWLTNALADQIVRRDVRDRDVAITAAHVDAAKETIILERWPHIDSMIARLREPRVRWILEPMLKGETPQGEMLDEDLAYLQGLGLIRVRGGKLEVANPIYREVIQRAFTYTR